MSSILRINAEREFFGDDVLGGLERARQQAIAEQRLRTLRCRLTTHYREYNLPAARACQRVIRRYEEALYYVVD